MSVNRRLAKGEFERQLAFGQIAESEISKWIIARGGYVLPVYDVEYDTGKGPRIFGAGRQIVAPDLIVFSHGGVSWIEAKHKTVFSWHRISGRWVTGIDLHHYRQYLEVLEIAEWPVWLLFLHRCSAPSPDDSRYPCCPQECPVGLFGGPLTVLRDKENHRSGKWGRSGMVYWSNRVLTRLATLDELDGKQPAKRNGSPLQARKGAETQKRWKFE